MGEIGQAVAGLEAWFETMRQPGGYGGPVAHWWRDCLDYTGPGLDWRYEGIILGYLNLWAATGDGQWLAKARRAGDDLVAGQLPSGNYRNSEFELNPGTGGTPHEAAADLALLSLAEALRVHGETGWQVYLATAERNLRGYYIARLWDAERSAFRDHPAVPSFVPNKSATLVEALLKWSAVTGNEEWAEVYARPTLDTVLSHQVDGGVLDGAIAQYSHNGRLIHKYFPYYIARCVSGLVAGYQWNGKERWLEGAKRGMAFVLRQRRDDGSFPQVVYAGGQVNRYPQWIAATADILRAQDLLRPHGVDADSEPTRQWLLSGQMPSGAFRTAHGFASQAAGQRPPGPVPEFRDLLPVCGWNDKAFRWLTQQVPNAPGSTGWRNSDVQTQCTWNGVRLVYREDTTAIALLRNGERLYHWNKEEPWAEDKGLLTVGVGLS